MTCAFLRPSLPVPVRLAQVPVSYDFQIDPLDNFSISRQRGVIAAATTGHVTISFKSSITAIYWKRVSCLVKVNTTDGNMIQVG